LKALVTNCTRNSGLVVMRELAASGWEVHGADDRVPPLGLHSSSAAAPYVLLPDESAPVFAAELLRTLRATRPDVLIPTRGIEAACRNADAVRALTSTLLPSVAAFEMLNDKALLLDHCERHGFGTPRRFELPEAREYLETNEHPGIVIKPRLDVGGGEDVWFLHSADGIDAVHARVARRAGGALISELIPGDTSCIIALHLLFDAQSRLVAHFAMRKLRIWPVQRGVTAFSISVHVPDILAAVLPLLQELRWQGPVDVEVKLDARDGRARMLEINPRFSGAIAFPIGCGIDMAERFCRAALGETLPEQPAGAYPADVAHLDPLRWLQAAMAQRHEPGNLGRILDELRSPRIPGLLRLSDPGAWLGKVLLRWGAHAEDVHG
jgi:NAD(P)-dependent dehydrogenase (short-subunit alcohol dehydrogenase family)